MKDCGGELPWFDQLAVPAVWAGYNRELLVDESESPLFPGAGGRGALI